MFYIIKWVGFIIIIIIIKFIFSNNCVKFLHFVFNSRNFHKHFLIHVSKKKVKMIIIIIKKNYKQNHKSQASSSIYIYHSFHM